MTRNRHASDDLTPQGGLGEGDIRRLLGYQLAQAAIVTTQAFTRVVGKPLSLRPVEFTILQLVHENTPVTATNLAKALGVTTPGVVIWLDRLEQRGLVKRERGVADRRTQIVRLTRMGEELVASALANLLEADTDLLGEFTVAERLMLLDLLHEVARRRDR